MLEEFSFELGASIFHAGQFPLDIRKRIGNQFVDGFIERRKEANPRAIDFVRYARVRQARVVTYAAKKGELALEGRRVKPGTSAFQQWIDIQVHERWKNVEDALGKYKEMNP